MRTVMFDWNGTLFNDARIWYQVFSETFRHFGSPPPTLDEVCRHTNQDGARVQDLYLLHGITALPEEIRSVFQPKYDRLAAAAALSPHARDVLLDLSFDEHQLWLVTANQRDQVEPYLRKFGLVFYFLGCFYESYSKDAVIREICARTGASEKETFYIGDTPRDIIHARRAGVVSVAYVGDGLIPQAQFTAVQADYIIGDLADVSRIVAQHSTAS